MMISLRVMNRTTGELDAFTGLEMGICENKHFLPTFLPISFWQNAGIAGTIAEVNLWLWKQTTLIWRRPNTHGERVNERRLHEKSENCRGSFRNP